MTREEAALQHVLVIFAGTWQPLLARILSFGGFKSDSVGSTN